MVWYNLLPTNKYVWIGFTILILGFLTLPFLIGLLIIPVGSVIFVVGIHKAWYDAGKSVYNLWQNIKKFKSNNTKN